MTSQGHKKHAKLKQPAGGQFHLNEIAILGAPCGMIQKLSRELAEKLDGLKVGYVDASHSSEEEAGVFSVAYTDRIKFHQVSFQSAYMEYEWRWQLRDADLVLVNGNHFTAEKQLPIINEAKKESLRRKLDRLTNVLGFALDEGQQNIHDYLQSDFSEKPTFSISDTAAIAEMILKEMRRPHIKGLVLTGGKSQRMGQNKGLIKYHGMPQREYLAKLLSKFCEETYWSVVDEVEGEFPVIMDTFSGLGPYGGILSAFRSDPNAAWLVVATDIPLLSEDNLRQLIEGRNVSKMATCFHNPETGFPEPLITLWEPRAYPRLLHFLSLGYSCPRKALINSEVEELSISNQDALLNANTPEEREQIFAKLHA